MIALRNFVAVMIAATTVAFFSGASVSSSGPKPTTRSN